MTAERASPVQVRLPPKVEADLRRIAAEKGMSLHAEIVTRLEASLASYGEEVEITALKTVTTELANSIRWTAGRHDETEEQHRDFLLSLYRSASMHFFGYLGALRAPPQDLDLFGDRLAKTLYARIRVALDKKPTEQNEEDRALANAGAALLPVKKEKRS